MKLKPLHSLLNLAHTLICHCALAALCLAAAVQPLLIPIVFIACLIHQKVVSEWMHEGAHYNFFTGQDANDALLNILLCPFFMEEIKFHRAKHLRHHQVGRYFVADDPDTNSLPIEDRKGLWQGLIADLTGRTAVRAVLGVSNAPTSKGYTPGLWQKLYSPLFALMHISFLLLCLVLVLRAPAYTAASVPTRAGLIFWSCYLLSLITLYPALNRLRVYCQHFSLDSNGVTSVEGSKVSRTIDAGFLDRVVFNSARMLFHYEHHAKPSVPYRDLGALCTRGDDTNRFVTSRVRLAAALYRGLPSRAALQPRREAQTAKPNGARSPRPTP